MPVFKIYTEQSLGFAHYGEVMVDGTGEVELTDEEVNQLVELIRKNDGKADVEEINLEEEYPDIYEKLDDAYRDAAIEALWNHWVIEVYDNGYYEEPDDMYERCERDYGFKFEYDENDFIPEGETEMDEDEFAEARSEAFYEWVENKRKTLDMSAEALFLAKVFDIEVEADNYDYDVEIPEEIVKMAKEGES